MDTSNYKSLFAIPNGIYLANHSLGCLPHTTHAALQKSMMLWQTEGIGVWTEWLEDINHFHAQLADLFSAKASEFCHQTNVSAALGKILSALPQRKGRNKIIAAKQDFPSLRFQLELFQRLGYELMEIETKPNDLTQWAAVLKEDVQLVFITHVSSRNNALSPVQEIVKLASELSIYSIIDVAQSAGIVPISFHEWNATFVIGSSLKWLCGGAGAGFLWVSTSNTALFNPSDVGWFSTPDPFNLPADTHFHYANTALKFAGGTPSPLPCLIAGESIKQLNAIKVSTIHHHNQTLIQLLIDELRNYFSIVSPKNPEARGGSLCLEVDGPVQLLEYLKTQNIYLEFPRIVHDNSFIRISPHIYNTKDEIYTIVDALKTWAKKGSKHAR